MNKQNFQVASAILVGSGVLLGLWSTAAFVAGLSRAGTISELVRQYIVALYNIKGIEYLLLAVVIVGLPILYTYVNEERQKTKI